jgi:hypothetical protein
MPPFQLHLGVFQHVTHALRTLQPLLTPRRIFDVDPAVVWRGENACDRIEPNLGTAQSGAAAGGVLTSIPVTEATAPV